MNVITYDVYKNTVKKHDGFNPVTSEKNYTKLQFRFQKGDDWEKCTLVTASFWLSNDNIVKSNVELLSDNLTATFDIPPEFSGVKGALKIGLQGKCGKDVIIATNIITLNRNNGVIVTEGANTELYQKIIDLVNKYFNDDKAQIDTFISEVNVALSEFYSALSKKSDKATTIAGYGITDAYTKNEVDTALANKPGFDDVYNVEEADEHFLSKYDAGNTYATKTNLITKADKATTYTKDETDTLLSNKLDNTAGSVTTDNIASKAVTSDKIANGAITATKIATNAVSGSNIEKNQVGTNHLQSGAVTSEKLADEVKKSINGKSNKATTLEGYGITDAYTKNEVDTELAKKVTNASFYDLKNNLSQNGLFVFESYPYEWMYAIKDIRITDGSTLAIGYVKRTSTRNTINLYLVENGALSTVKLYANADSDISGYATYSNLAKTVTMTVNWDEIPYDTVIDFGSNYVLCSAWCYGNTRLEYLFNKVKEEAVSYAELNKLDNTEGSVKRKHIEVNAVGTDEIDSDAVNTINIADGAVVTDKIASKAVTSDKIAAGAVTALKIAKGAVSGSNIADNQISTAHLQSSAVTTDKLADDVIETGIGSLTSGSSYTDLIKSSNFTYQKTGKIVNIFFNIVFNAGSATYLQFNGLPFIPDEMSEQNRHMGISNKNIQAAVYPVKSTLVLNFLGEKSLGQDEVFKDVLTIEIS